MKKNVVKITAKENINNDIYIKRQLKNAEGKRLLQKVILEYSKDIIDNLKQNPSILNDVLEELEISKSEFFEYLTCEKKGNITMYDQTLYLIKELNKNNLIRKK